jgi:transitional endoplasmic reticulum ATPase
MKKEKKQLLAALAEAGGKQYAEEDIKFRGTDLILPEKMDIADAIAFLKDKMAEDEEEMNFSHTFDYRPWDGARAASMALRRIFGMTRQQPIMTMFGKQPPQQITIHVGPGETEQVPWGAVTIPLLPKTTIYFGSARHEEKGLLFSVQITAPRKYRHECQGIFNLIEEELSQNSMYRGKAFDGREEAEFLDLSTVQSGKVIYSDEVITQLDANVWSQLEHTDLMEGLGVPLKRAVLLEGPYGTGKTLAAYLTAKKATENGWTFIYCRPGRDSIQDVMATAQLYQPAVVFFEDVDTISTDDKNADHVTKLLDVFDGIKAKGTKILAVLTTNHVKSIHKGMCRPGRLDAILHIGALDRNGVQRLVEATIPADLLDRDVDYDAVYEAMEGYMPAFCKEAVDRSIRYAITRNGGPVDRITTADLVEASMGLRGQFDLMQDAHEGKDVDPLSASLVRVIRTAVDGVPVVDGDESPFVLGDATRERL